MTGQSELTIEPFDPMTATEGELRARHALNEALELELFPEDPVTPFDALVEGMRTQVSWNKSDRWAVWDGPGHHRMLAYAYLSRGFTETNRNLGWFGVDVDADHRRQGLATRLLEPILDVAEGDGRTMLGGEAREGSAGTDFLTALGAGKKSVERKSRLEIPKVDDALIEQWVSDAAVKAAGYTAVAWDGPVPDEDLDAFVRVRHVMNTAPRDDLEMEDWVHTAERQREQEQKVLDKGDWWWTIAVRHDASGEFAGFTDIWFSKWFDDLCWQGNTGVDPAHRGKAIGRWLKAAMLLRLKAEKPKVWRIDTWNAGSNDHMLAINNDLGFEVVQWFGAWQVPTADLRATVAKRLGS
jgi:GNAT superfamily N-acetyltransferase